EHPLAARRHLHPFLPSRSPRMLRGDGVHLDLDRPAREPTIGFSRAVRVGDRVHVSGTGPIWPDGSCDLDPEEQTRRCFAIAAAALADVGSSLDDVVRTRMYITSADVACCRPSSMCHS